MFTNKTLNILEDDYLKGSQLSLSTSTWSVNQFHDWLMHLNWISPINLSGHFNSNLTNTQLTSLMVFGFHNNLTNIWIVGLSHIIGKYFWIPLWCFSVRTRSNESLALGPYSYKKFAFVNTFCPYGCLIAGMANIRFGPGRPNTTKIKCNDGFKKLLKNYCDTWKFLPVEVTYYLIKDISSLKQVKAILQWLKTIQGNSVKKPANRE